MGWDAWCAMKEKFCVCVALLCERHSCAKCILSFLRDCDRQNNGYDCQKTKNCYKFLLVYQLQYCAMHCLVWRQTIAVVVALFFFFSSLHCFRHAGAIAAASLCFHCRTMKLWKFSFITEPDGTRTKSNETITGHTTRIRNTQRAREWEQNDREKEKKNWNNINKQHVEA